MVRDTIYFFNTRYQVRQFLDFRTTSFGYFVKILKKLLLYSYTLLRYIFLYYHVYIVPGWLINREKKKRLRVLLRPSFSDNKDKTTIPLVPRLSSDMVLHGFAFSSKLSQYTIDCIGWRDSIRDNYLKWVWLKTWPHKPRFTSILTTIGESKVFVSAALYMSHERLNWFLQLTIFLFCFVF